MGGFDGGHDVPQLPFNPTFAGVDLGNALFLPSGGQVFYVRGNGTSVTEYDYDPPGIRERLNASLNVALGQCVASRGDVVVLMEGHAETIGNSGDAWSNIKAGVKIVGRGNGTTRPTFTFNHANAQLDIDVANVLIYNCRFLAAGPAGTTALSVANPFNVTAAGFHLVKNFIEVGVDADQLCTDCIKLAAGADDTVIAYNRILGNAGSEITTVLTTTGAVDRLSILNNVVTADVVTAATGVLFDLSNAAISHNLILGNQLANNTASSKFVIKPHATSTGFVDGNKYYTGDGATAPASSAWTTYTTNYKFGKNECVTAVSVSALLSPAVDA